MAGVVIDGRVVPVLHVPLARHDVEEPHRMVAAPFHGSLAVGDLVLFEDAHRVDRVLLGRGDPQMRGEAAGGPEGRIGQSLVEIVGILLGFVLVVVVDAHLLDVAQPPERWKA